MVGEHSEYGREVIYAVDEHIATVTLNRPERINSFSADLLGGWEDSIRRAEDDDVRVVVITGNGRAFCAGADLKATDPNEDYAQAGERNAGQRRNSLRLVYRGLDQPFMEALEQAQAAMTIVQSTEDSKEGPAAFVKKRAPAFQGR